MSMYDLIRNGVWARMWLILLLMFSQAEQPAKVTTLDGQVQEGRLSRISTDAVTVRTSAADAAIPLKSVMAVDFSAIDAASPTDDVPAQQLLLHDGSQLAGSSIRKTARQLTMTTTDLGELQVPATAVRAVRLVPEDPAFVGQWKTFLQRQSEQDLLIVPKRDGDGLDFLAGIITAISAEQVSFLLDGDNIPVPAARVYGIVFAKPAATGLVGGAILRTRSDENISASALTFDGVQFQVTTGWGQSLQIPADRLSRIDYSSGRIHYLSDLAAVREDFSGIDPEGSLFAGLIDQQTARLMYGPRRNTTIDPRLPLRLRGRRFDKGLCIHSRTQMVWALDRRYTSLEALIGVDDEVAFNQSSKVSLRITGDDQVLFDEVLGSQDEPRPLKLNLENVATLTILVDYADNDSSCDWLDLADAKLILAAEGK